jgi:hypothetical protein
MPNILRQKRSIIYLVILVFIFNSIITSCKRKNTTELNNGTMMTTLPSESLSTESLSTEPLLSTSSSDTKQTCDETTVQVESETQIPTELSNFQELISPAFRISKVSPKILRAKDGVIYTVPDNDDMQKQKEEPIYKLKYNVYSKEKDAIDNSQKITKTITFNYDGKYVKFNVSYVEKGNKKAIDLLNNLIIVYINA